MAKTALKMDQVQKLHASVDGCHFHLASKTHLANRGFPQFPSQPISQAGKGGVGGFTNGSKLNMEGI